MKKQILTYTRKEIKTAICTTAVISSIWSYFLRYTEQNIAIYFAIMSIIPLFVFLITKKED